MTEKLNIVFISKSFNKGMAGCKRIRNLINAFEKNSDPISNLVITNSREKIQKRNIEENDPKYLVINYNLYNPLVFIIYLIKGMSFIQRQKKRNIKNFIYYYGRPDSTTILFVVFARLIGFKTVVDIVEDISVLSYSKKQIGKYIKISMINFLINNIAKYSNAVVVISSTLKEKLQKVSKNKIPLLLLPISVDFSYYKAYVKSLDLDNDVIRIFHGSSFAEKDGLAYLFKAFEQLAAKYPKLSLLLSGKPSKDGMAYVFDFIKNSKFENRVNFLGYLSDESYYYNLNNADIHCMVRTNSAFANAGFPFKLGEMLATGKPVISTRVSDISQYLRDKENAILIPPDSSQSIIQAVSLLIENKELAAKIGKNGRQTANEYFDSNMVGLKLREFLLKIH